MAKKEKKRGDRHDGYLVHSGDPMHVIMPYILGERADNEAFMNITVDMSEVDKYLKKKNDENPQYKYTYFHVILAALAKTIYLRPRMNRFIIGHRYYDRDNISFTFTAKNKFSDSSDESVVIVKADEESDVPIVQQMHDKVCSFVYKIREEGQVDGTTSTMDWMSKIPRPIFKVIVRLLFFLDYHDKLPKSIQEIDPYSSSVFVSNLGSIKMTANYHHLINWSTNSVFVITNRCKVAPFFNEDGTYEMKNSMDISITIDERIADGYYFMKSLLLCKHILAHPEILDEPLNAPLDTDGIF